MIRLSKSSISEAEKQAVIRVLDKEYLGMGAEVQMFEKMLSEYFGRTAVCVANGTAALQLAVQATGIGHGDEVLIPSLTYVASFQAISATGAKPIACDIDAKTCMLNWKDAEKRLTPLTKAVMPVHYTGGVGPLDEIYSFAKLNNLRVIEDAAHAFGTIYKQKKIGGFGDISCFSFDGIKNITCGEGGCIVTDDLDIIRKVQDARLVGVEKDTEKRYTGQRSWEFDVTAQGWRYHMSNIMAAIGIEQFKRLKHKNAELIIIDNTHSDFYDNDPRITIVKCTNNIFVNPAWNIGVKLARNNYICLLNDDIYFNYVNLFNNFERFIDQNPNLGLIGFNENSRVRDNSNILNKDDDELILVDTTGIVPFAYGCCMFLKKEDYFDIYEECKIFYGDTILIVSIIDIKRKYMYYIDNLISIGRISVSSDDYPKNMESDEIEFYKQYKILKKIYV